jgi:hypothetical protein
MKPSYDASHLRQQLERQSVHLRALLVKLPDHDAITDVFDYVVGAQYGLMRAIEIGFVDRPGAWHSTYRPHLPQYVEHIANGRPVNKLWLAGFYFNSGIQRLAACFDRIPKLLSAKGRDARKRMNNTNTGTYAAWDKVYGEINSFKHDITGRATGRTVTLTEAVQAFEEVVALLKANEAKLLTAYALP